MNYVPFKVYVEDTGDAMEFQFTETEAAKVTTDKGFLIKLVNDEYAKQKSKTGKIINACISMEKGLSSVPSSSTSASTSEAGSISIPLSDAQSIQYTSAQNVEESTDNDKSLFIWTSKTIFLLLEKYEERMNEFSSGTKRHYKIWESIANDMNKVDPNIIVSGSQCQSKMNGMKKMYRKIIDHNNVSGNDRKSWQYFERMSELFGKSGWVNPKAVASEAGPLSSADLTDENKNIKEPVTKKLKSDKLLEEFMKQIKEDRQEREKKKEARQIVVLQELKEQKEKQHKEKMDIMKKFCEAITGKKLFD